MDFVEKIKCSSCGEILPATPEYFTPRKSRKRGFASSCRECVNKKNKEKTLENKKLKYDSIQEKCCSKCLQTKQICEFRKRKNREYGVYSMCKECEKKDQTDYRIKNHEIIVEKRKLTKESDKKRSKEYYYKNKEKVLGRCKSYRENNHEVVKERVRNYYNRNKDKYALTARARDSIVKNTKIDFGELSDFIISESYTLRDLRNTLTGIKWQVDHIVPLKSNFVCGLHNGFNLRILTEYENRKKGNRFWDDMPEYTPEDLLDLKFYERQ